MQICFKCNEPQLNQYESICTEKISRFLLWETQQCLANEGQNSTEDALSW